MTTIDVVTIFPAMIDAVLSEGVIGRARVNGLVDVKARDLRDYTSDKHRVVDDMPFGGGPGMVLKPEPLFRAVDEITAERGAPDAVVLMTPQGTGALACRGGAIQPDAAAGGVVRAIRGR